LYFDDLDVGREWESPARTITEADVVAFAGFSGDTNPVHLDHDFARGTPFRRPIAHGLLVMSAAGGLATHAPPLRALALQELREWRFLGPVYFGDTIRVIGRVTGKEPRGRGRRGTVTWRRQVLNQEGKAVQEGVVVVLVEARAAPEEAAAGPAARR
jgi:acyl dehydratase